jgi:hypothetical protein
MSCILAMTSNGAEVGLLIRRLAWVMGFKPQRASKGELLWWNELCCIQIRQELKGLIIGDVVGEQMNGVFVRLCGVWAR